MRPRFLFTLVISAAMAVLAAVLLNQFLSPAKPKPEVATPPAVVPVVAPAPALPPLTPAPVVVKTPTPEEREKAIAAETDQLSIWSMKDDAQSLSNILTDLHSPEKEIRMAAIEAAKQFGDTNAIPALKAAAMSSDNTDEQIAMLEAADFISLPDAIMATKGDSQTTLTPEQSAARAQSQAAAAARYQAYMAKHHPDQAPQNAPPGNPPVNPPGK